MKGIVISTKNKMQIGVFAQPAFESIGKAVGGWIEVVHPKALPSPYCMVVNEEGLLLNLPLNMMGCMLYGMALHGNPIVGDIVLLKEGMTDEGERDFIGLDHDDINFLGAMLIGMTDGMVEWEAQG